jgi:glycosyltransferase involved in cell wall biosynthesis
MPVRNALPYLECSIESILNQTYGDFEFVIGDDGSTDGSGELLARYAARDPRIRLHLNSGVGFGPAGSSNWVARLARHDIVARMDADDISAPQRLEAQLRALDADRSAVLVGSAFDCIDPRGRRFRSAARRPPAATPDTIPPFAHGSIMYRRGPFERIGGYRPNCDFWEDLDLYWRLAGFGRLLVLPDVHYSYRCSDGHSRLKADRLRVEQALDLAARCARAHLKGRDYEPLLAEHPARGRVAASVFRWIGGLELRSGQRPFILPSLLRRGSLRFDWETASTFLWGLAAAVAPRRLQAFADALAEAAASRNAHLVPDHVYEWRPRPAGPRAASANAL